MVVDIYDKCFFSTKTVFSTLLDAARRCLTLLDAARRCSTLLDAARRCSTLLDAALILM
jgi:hypothetical protein